jgi:hypothetical protein
MGKKTADTNLTRTFDDHADTAVSPNVHGYMSMLNTNVNPPNVSYVCLNTSDELQCFARHIVIYTHAPKSCQLRVSAACMHVGLTGTHSLFAYILAYLLLL